MLKSGQLLHQVHAVRGIQEIQIFTAASTSLILQAASDICHNIFYSCSKNLTRKNQRHAPNKNQRCPFPCKESKSRIKPVQEEHEKTISGPHNLKNWQISWWFKKRSFWRFSCWYCRVLPGRGKSNKILLRDKTNLKRKTAKSIGAVKLLPNIFKVPEEGFRPRRVFIWHCLIFFLSK